MKRLIQVHENDMYLVFGITDSNQVRFLHFSPEPYVANSVPFQLEQAAKLVELQESGMDNSDHHGMKHTGSLPGAVLTYRDFRDYRNHVGRKLEIEQEYKGLTVTSHFQFYSGIGTIRAWTGLKNQSGTNRHIEYVTSFAYYLSSFAGEKEWKDKMQIHIPHNSWYAESRWQNYTLPQLGLNPINMMADTKRIYANNVGTWSSSGYLPCACLENTDAHVSYFWQIENNGSWYWEVGASAGDIFNRPEDSDMMITTEGTAPAEIYFQLSGPTEQDSQWHKVLKPGDSFTSVPVAVSAVKGNFENAVGEMTKYRREIRRPNEDNEKLPVIFNDYMNCLFGDSTTKKLIPLIDAAAEAGCEYFCIDCGWYTDTNWWGGVGDWLPSEKRYPGGIKIPLDYIRSKGMIPGLWLEIEVMGFGCDKVKNVPKDWFFIRHGFPVGDQRRYQLDFRNSEVRDYATKTINRMVNEYGVGYIKMDYNINGGVGTELNSDSFGDGLLEHNRAYLRWLDSIFEKYPDLVIENCGSGGMRMDYAMLSRHSIQSSSDQTDYMKNAAIAASSSAAITPEQCAVWSYPLATGDREEVVANMVNALLLRIHQSGHLSELTPERFDLVKEGITCYKNIRGDIKNGIPFWPLGMAEFTDPWFAFGLDCGNKLYLAVWRSNGSSNCTLPVHALKRGKATINCIYPDFSEDTATIDCKAQTVSVSFEREKTARLFEIDFL